MGMDFTQKPTEPQGVIPEPAVASMDKPEVQTAEPVPRLIVWLHRLSLVVFVVFCIELGMLLAIVGTMTKVVSAAICRMQQSAKVVLPPPVTTSTIPLLPAAFQSPRASFCQARSENSPTGYPVAAFPFASFAGVGASKLSMRLASARNRASFMRRTLSGVTLIN